MSNPTDPKVLVAAATGGIVAPVAAVLVYALDSIPLVAAWPATIQGDLSAVVLAGVTYAAVFAAGWFTKHAPVPVVDAVEKLAEPVAVPPVA
ncbi:hypothetical protein [Fodinicola feengrottensis]|uniref:Holin n=1 Tax=Fodinicola feengrottensis TaxID=435914 RepID=A0ABN2IB97_9ACTN|nr:hypothetical protein [Fodinicola feengrottensis]